MAGQPVFYYDLGDPWCYVVAEQVMTSLRAVPEWEPVLAADVAIGERTLERAQVERAAGVLGIQPLRWPPQLPPDTHRAMLAATYAKRVGRAVAFSLAAFRQAFAGGRDLGDENTVLIAAAAAEMHPAALLKGIGLRSIQDGLRHANARAQAAGVTTLPAIQIGDSVLQGQNVLDQAARTAG